ncbi:MAG: helix-turn-helix transcriptional regulator [Limnohabitans sp.]
MPIIDQLMPVPSDFAVTPDADGLLGNLPPEWFLPSVHSVYFQLFSRMLALPLSAAQRESLAQPRLLPLLDYLPIFDATRAVHRPHDGRLLGLQIPMAAHGAMGAAALASDSLGEAMQTIARYAHIRNRLFDFECRREAGWVSLWMCPRIPLGEYARFVENVTVFGKFSILHGLANPLDLQRARVSLPWAQPTEGLPADSPTGPECVYSAARLGFELPIEVADRPSALSDANLYRHVCQAGDEELERLKGSVSAKVRHYLHAQQPLWPSLDQVAERLSMSRRTLLRKLESEKIGYQQLLDEARNELACWYLRQSRMPLGHVAEMIGFSDQTNFSRSFKRWKGLSPRDYRRQFSSA